MIRLEIVIDNENKIRVYSPTGEYWHAKSLADLPIAVANCLRGYAGQVANFASQIPDERETTNG
jgi:hypothetical protein